MKNDAFFVRDMRKDLKRMKSIINNYELYNFKVHVSKFLLNIGKTLYRLSPYTLSGTILFGLFHSVDATPFQFHKAKPIFSFYSSDDNDILLITNDSILKSNEWEIDDNEIKKIVMSYNIGFLDEEKGISIINNQYFQQKQLDNYNEDLILVSSDILNNDEEDLNNKKSILYSIIYCCSVIGIPASIILFRKYVLKKDDVILNKITSIQNDLVLINQGQLNDFLYLYNMEMENYKLLIDDDYYDNCPDYPKIKRKSR